MHCLVVCFEGFFFFFFKNKKVLCFLVLCLNCLLMFLFLIEKTKVLTERAKYWKHMSKEI
jgi:hypothetical protein